MCGSDLESISLAVEVSGWDAEGSFFIEHSTLDCSQSGCKVLALRNPVGSRSLIFLRTLYMGYFAKSCPEAYQVERIESSEGLGFNNLHLADFLPRRSGAYEPKGLAEHLIDVREEVKS